MRSAIIGGAILIGCAINIEFIRDNSIAVIVLLTIFYIVDGVEWYIIHLTNKGEGG